MAAQWEGGGLPLSGVPTGDATTTSPLGEQWLRKDDRILILQDLFAANPDAQDDGSAPAIPQEEWPQLQGAGEQAEIDFLRGHALFLYEEGTTGVVTHTCPTGVRIATGPTLSRSNFQSWTFMNRNNIRVVSDRPDCRDPVPASSAATPSVPKKSSARNGYNPTNADGGARIEILCKRVLETRVPGSSGEEHHVFHHAYKRKVFDAAAISINQERETSPAYCSDGKTALFADNVTPEQLKNVWNKTLKQASDYNPRADNANGSSHGGLSAALRSLYSGIVQMQTKHAETVQKTKSMMDASKTLRRERSVTPCPCEMEMTRHITCCENPPTNLL
jgi:hypothetical protein